MKKNVWLLNHYANLPGRGLSLRHFNFAKELVQRGYNVYIFASSAAHNFDFNAIEDGASHKEEIVRDVHFVYIRTCSYVGNNLKRLKNILEYTFRLAKIAKIYAKVNMPDVIIGTSMHPLTLFAGRRIAKKLNSEYIIEIRDLWPETIKNYNPKFNRFLMGIFRSIEKYIYKRAKNIIITVEGGKDYILDMGWQKEIPLEKIAYINNGIDLKAFIENKELYTTKDEDLSDKTIFSVVYTGAIRKTNAIGILVETAALLKEREINDVKLLIWGGGDELDYWKNQANGLGLDNIVFKGAVQKEYIPGIVSAADLNILHQINANMDGVYKYGSSQNKKFDYLAAGKPILCTVKTNYDVIVQGKCGITLDIQSPETIVDGILYFRNMSSEEYNGYGERAFKTAEAFDFVKLTDRLEAVIESD